MYFDNLGCTANYKSSKNADDENVCTALHIVAASSTE